MGSMLQTVVNTASADVDAEEWDPKVEAEKEDDIEDEETFPCVALSLYVF